MSLIRFVSDCSHHSPNLLCFSKNIGNNNIILPSPPTLKKRQLSNDHTLLWQFPKIEQSSSEAYPHCAARLLHVLPARGSIKTTSPFASTMININRRNLVWFINQRSQSKRRNYSYNWRSKCLGNKQTNWFIEIF